MYQDFVPWCQRSEILKSYPDGSFDAELEIGFKFLVESYVSHVELQRPNYVKVKVLSNYPLISIEDFQNAYVAWENTMATRWQCFRRPFI